MLSIEGGRRLLNLPFITLPWNAWIRSLSPSLILIFTITVSPGLNSSILPTKEFFNVASGFSASGSSALGSSALGSSALGSSALGSSALGSSALGSSALGSSALGS